MDLFVPGPYRAKSGKVLPYKVEADALSDVSIQTCAETIARTHTFREVHSVPRGGDRLARALQAYLSQEGVVLIVDDVLTSGASMEKKKLEVEGDPVGIVIVARGECPDWVRAIMHIADWAQ